MTTDTDSKEHSDLPPQMEFFSFKETIRHSVTSFVGFCGFLKQTIIMKQILYLLSFKLKMCFIHYV